MPNRDNSKTWCVQLTNEQVDIIRAEFPAGDDGVIPTKGAILAAIIEDYFAARSIPYPESRVWGETGRKD